MSLLSSLKQIPSTFASFRFLNKRAVYNHLKTKRIYPCCFLGNNLVELDLLKWHKLTIITGDNRS